MPTENVDYAEVADVYLNAVERQAPPTRAVQAAYGIGYSTAAQRVMRARDLGFIPPLDGPSSTGMKLAPRCPTCGAQRAHWAKPDGD